MKETESNTYYYVELSQEVYDRINNGCKLIDQMICGNLDAVKEMAYDAYRYRTGMDVPPNIQRNINDCIAGLQLIGWNRPIDSVSRMGTESDIYRDIHQTLDHQQAILGKMNTSEGAPPHYCKDIPLPRIIDIVKVAKRRRIQLKTFCMDYSNKRRL